MFDISFTKNSYYSDETTTVGVAKLKAVKLLKKIPGNLPAIMTNLAL